MHALPLILVATERPLINVDITLLINIGLWLVLFFFLRATFWKPMLALIAAREAGTEGSRADARRLSADAAKLRDQFETALREARTGAAVERDRIRAEGVRRENEILQQVRTEVTAMVEKQRAEIDAERVRLRAEVLAAVPALASDIASKLLRREVRS